MFRHQSAILRDSTQQRVTSSTQYNSQILNKQNPLIAALHLCSFFKWSVFLCLAESLRMELRWYLPWIVFYVLYFLSLSAMVCWYIQYKYISNTKFAVWAFFCVRKSSSSTASQQIKTFFRALYSTETPYGIHSSTPLVPILWHTSSTYILILFHSPTQCTIPLLHNNILH
jgi:hypothetical protein